MAIFAIIDDGVVINTIVADGWDGGIDITKTSPRPSIGWRYANGEFLPPAERSTPLMTHYAFNERLTLEEDVALEVALPSSPLLRVALRRFKNAKDVNVSLPETQQMVGLLAQMGIVAPERIADLLAQKPLAERGAIDPKTGAITP